MTPFITNTSQESPFKHSGSHLARCGIAQTSARIQSLLSDEVLANAQSSLQQNLSLLTEIVTRKSQELNYDYADYSQRLETSEEDSQKVFGEHILTDPHISTLYEAILKDALSPEVIKQRLWEEYFFDLVIEFSSSGPTISPHSIDFLKTRIDAHYSVPLSVRNIKISSLEGHVDVSKIKAVFQQLNRVIQVDLSHNPLTFLDQTKLENIFSPLEHLKSINLRDSSLCRLPTSSLKAIFSHLSNLRSLHLRTNALGEIDPEGLKSIFFYLTRLKSMDLANNFLGNLDHSTLQIIFSHLSSIRSLDLSYNHLTQLDQSGLQAIFSQLTNVQRVVITESKEFVQKIETDFPYLIGKILYGA